MPESDESLRAERPQTGKEGEHAQHMMKPALAHSTQPGSALQETADRSHALLINTAKFLSERAGQERTGKQRHAAQHQQTGSRLEQGCSTAAAAVGRGMPGHRYSLTPSSSLQD